MNISVTRFLMFFILSFILPYSVNSYSYAIFDGVFPGKLKWKSVNGKVYITTNTITFRNIPPSVPCPTGCYFILDTGGVTYDIVFTSRATLADLNREVSAMQGQLDLMAGPYLCLKTLLHDTLGNNKGDAYPVNCDRNPNVGIPPEKPDPPITPPVTCNIGSGTINHLVASTSVDRDSASTTVSVSCTGSTTVRVRALDYYPNNGGVTLNGPDTLKSLIAIDGISAEQGAVKRVDYYRNFTVSSELRSAAKEIAGGEYSGSLVIVVATQ